MGREREHEPKQDLLLRSSLVISAQCSGARTHFSASNTSLEGHRTDLGDMSFDGTNQKQAIADNTGDGLLSLGKGIIPRVAIS